MSASERLAALYAELRETFERDAPWRTTDERRVLSALPEIGAVVQRMESNNYAQREVCMERGEKFPDWLVADTQALDDLERKLADAGS